MLEWIQVTARYTVAYTKASCPCCLYNVIDRVRNNENPRTFVYKCNECGRRLKLAKDNSNLFFNDVKSPADLEKWLELHHEVIAFGTTRQITTDIFDEKMKLCGDDLGNQQFELFLIGENGRVIGNRKKFCNCKIASLSRFTLSKMHVAEMINPRWRPGTEFAEAIVIK